MSFPFPRSLTSVAATLLLVGAACAQQDERRVELREAIGKQLVALARSASSQKVHSLAHELATLVVAHYDPDSPSARRVLGQKKVRGEWQGAPAKPAADAANDRSKSRLLDKWSGLKAEFGAKHRDLGAALRDGGAAAEQWRPEFELALYYLPDDEASHRAVGHEGVDGFWGSPDDVASVRRWQEVFRRAGELAGTEFEVTELKGADLPVELQRTGLAFFGARSANYTYWSVESYEAAATCVLWSERCHALLQHLLGEHKDLVRGNAWAWHCVLRTPEQRDAMLQNSPTTRGPFTFDQARLFAGLGFRAEAGGRAAVTWHEPGLDRDHSVANVCKRHFLDQRNEGFGEGLTHVMTWLLCGSVHTYFADLPKTVVGGVPALDRDADKWFERLWQEIDEGRDQPLTVVARERADNFRDSTRIKAWSFMLWLLGRHPDEWLPMIEALSAPELSPDDAEAAFSKVFGVPFTALQEDWRRWARRGSSMGQAAGFRPKQ